MKRLTVDLEEDLFKEFSKRCIDEGKRKNQVIRELIQQWTEPRKKPK